MSADLVSVKGYVVVAVYDIDRVAVLAELHRGIDMLDLVILGSQFAVALDDTVQAERLKVRLVAEISAISHPTTVTGRLFAGRFCNCAFRRDNDSLVNPVPNEAAEHTRIGINLVPILLEIAECVTHTVGIFRCEDRALVEYRAIDRLLIPLALRYAEQEFPTRILGTFLVTSLRHSRIEILLHHTRIEA